MVDMFGFAAVSSIACGLQVAVALCTFIYLVMFECSLVSRDPGLRWDEVTIVEQGRRRDEKVIFKKFPCINVTCFHRLCLLQTPVPVSPL